MTDPRWGPWARDDVRRAALRAVLGSCALTFCFRREGSGGIGWPLVAVVLAAGALIEGTAGTRREPGRIVDAALLAATAGLIGTAAALFNGVYVAGLFTGGPDGAAVDLDRAWRALAQPTTGDPLMPALPWYRAWLWAREPGCAAATAIVMAAVLGGTAAVRVATIDSERLDPKTGGWVPSAVGGFVAGIGAAIVVQPPGLPAEARFTTAQGLEEMLALLSLPVVACLAIGAADGISDRWRVRTAPDDATPRARRPRLLGVVACGLAWLVAWALLAEGPARVRGPRPEAALKAELATPGAVRSGALAALSGDVLALRAVWPHVLPLLEDPDPAARRRAAGVLRRTVAAEDAVVGALLARCERDEDADVRATAADTAGALALWGASLDEGPLLRLAERDPVPAVRAAALRALGAARCDSAEVVARLREALGSGTPGERAAALEALETAAVADEARAEVLRALEEPSLVDHASRVAARLGGDEVEVVRALALAHARSGSAAPLWALRGWRPDHATTLRALAADGDPAVRAAATGALEAMKTLR